MVLFLKMKSYKSKKEGLELLHFKKLTLEDKEIFKKYTDIKHYFLCDLYFPVIFIWDLRYNSSYAIEKDFLFVKQIIDGKTIFLPPLGSGDIKSAIKTLVDYTENEGIELVLTAVPKEIKDSIEEAFPDNFTIEENRDEEDYIYSAESLMTLAGKKLHGKRNHINKFLLTYGDRWSYEPMTEENIKEAFSCHLSWCQAHEGSFLSETCAFSVALKNITALELKGGILRLDGKIIAMTLGSQVNDDTFIVHFEKADGDIQGAYQMINQQFAIRNFQGLKYVNREDDLGIEGLRKAKLSYFPEFLAENYTCRYIK